MELECCARRTRDGRTAVGAESGWAPVSKTRLLRRIDMQW